MYFLLFDQWWLVVFFYKPLLCSVRRFIFGLVISELTEAAVIQYQCHSRFIEARYLKWIRTWKLETAVFRPSASNLRILLPRGSLCVHFNVFKSKKVFITISDSPHTLFMWLYASKWINEVSKGKLRPIAVCKLTLFHTNSLSDFFFFF